MLELPLRLHCVLGLRHFPPKRSGVSEVDLMTHWKLSRSWEGLWDLIWAQNLHDCLEAATLPWQWSLITISQENDWFHHYVPDWPLPPRVYIQSESEMALQHVSRIPVVWRSVHLLYSDVCGWSVWRLKCFSSNLVHLHKRYRGKWVTCIRAFDVGNDFPAYQISCYSGFGLSEGQILFSDMK